MPLNVNESLLITKVFRHGCSMKVAYFRDFVLLVNRCLLKHWMESSNFVLTRFTRSRFSIFRKVVDMDGTVFSDKGSDLGELGHFDHLFFF